VLIQHYERDSETFYNRTQFLILFLYVELGINKMIESGHEDALLWQARHAFIHNNILTNNIEHLQDLILDNWGKYLAAYRQRGIGLEGDEKKAHRRGLAMLLSESSYAQIQFWKYEACEEAVIEAFDILGLELDLAGKLGRRTKW
jgi:hypothetical protein